MSIYLLLFNFSIFLRSEAPAGGRLLPAGGELAADRLTEGWSPLHRFNIICAVSIQVKERVQPRLYGMYFGGVKERENRPPEASVKSSKFSNEGFDTVFFCRITQIKWFLMLIFDRICPQLCFQFKCLEDLLKMVDIFGQSLTLSEGADNVSVALGVLY